MAANFSIFVPGQMIARHSMGDSGLVLPIAAQLGEEGRDADCGGMVPRSRQMPSPLTPTRSQSGAPMTEPPEEFDAAVFGEPAPATVLLYFEPM